MMTGRRRIPDDSLSLQDERWSIGVGSAYRVVTMPIRDVRSGFLARSVSNERPAPYDSKPEPAQNMRLASVAVIWYPSVYPAEPARHDDCVGR